MPQKTILTKNDTWTCPGTAVERNGRWFILHHAYQTGRFENVGRQGILSEFVWTKADWPQFLNNHNRSTAAAKEPAVANDEFTAPALSPVWEWPVEDKPQFTLRDGRLQLGARPDRDGAALGRPALAANYTTTLLNPAALPAGLAVPGDPSKSLSLTVGDSTSTSTSTAARAAKMPCARPVLPWPRS